MTPELHFGTTALARLLLATAGASGDSLEHEERHRQGIHYLQGTPTLGRVEPDHGHMVLAHTTLTVSDELGELLRAAPDGARFALGPSLAPTLDTSLPIAIGKQKLDPALYFLVLERSGDGWSLVFIDSAAMRDSGWNGRGAPAFVTGQRIEALWERKPRKNAARGSINFSVPEGARTIHLNVWLGELHAWVELEPRAKKGQPAAWTDDSHLALWQDSADDDDLRTPFLALESGALPWDADVDAGLVGLRKGERFFATRMFWTTLVANAPFVLGGESLPAGDYSLALERSGKEDWSLFVLDSKDRRKRLLDPYNLEKAAPSHLVPLAHETLDESAAVLRFDVIGTAGARALEIRYGHHRWSAPLVIGP